MQLNSYHKLLIIAAVGIFCTNVPLYVYNNFGMTQTLAPKNWVLLFCLLSLPLLVIRIRTWTALKSPVMLWCIGYTLVTVLWFFPFSQSEVAWQEVRWRFLAIIELLAFLMVFWDQEATRLARTTLVIAVLIGVTLNIYELFAPRAFSEALGRSAGLYESPTNAGEALALGMILGVTVLAPRYRAPFILLVGVGIVTTFSRAAILTWAVGVVGLLVARSLSLRRLMTSIMVGLLLAVLLLWPQWDRLLTIWERTGVLNANVQQRLEWFIDPVGVSDYSSWERKYVAKLAWEKIAEQPVLGSGTGSSYQAYTSTHNQYLSFMQDHGVIGVMILPLLLLAVTWGIRGNERRVAIAFCCAVMFQSFFSHTMLVHSYTVLLFSLMAAMAATSGDHEVKRTLAVETRVAGTAQELVRS